MVGELSEEVSGWIVKFESVWNKQELHIVVAISPLQDPRFELGLPQSVWSTTCSNHVCVGSLVS